VVAEVLLVFTLGLGIGATAGWQSACLLYRSEESRRKVRAQAKAYTIIYGGLTIALVSLVASFKKD